MKNQSGTIKTNLELYRVVMGVQLVTGDSQEEVIIFRDKQTHMHHNIYIIIADDSIIISPFLAVHVIINVSSCSINKSYDCDHHHSYDDHHNDDQDDQLCLKASQTTQFT